MINEIRTLSTRGLYQGFYSKFWHETHDEGRISRNVVNTMMVSISQILKLIKKINLLCKFHNFFVSLHLFSHLIYFAFISRTQTFTNARTHTHTHTHTHTSRSHWVPLSYGLVPHLSKKLSKFPLTLLGSGRVDTAIWMHYLDAN